MPDCMKTFQESLFSAQAIKFCKAFYCKCGLIEIIRVIFLASDFLPSCKDLNFNQSILQLKGLRHSKTVRHTAERPTF